MYSPVRDSSEAVRSGKQDQHSAAVPLRGPEVVSHHADLAVFVQNVSVDVGDHVDLRMTGVTLSSLQVTMIQLQPVGCTGVPLWYNNDKPEMPTNP